MKSSGLKQANTELAKYPKLFHEADKKAAVLEEKNRFRISQEIISLACVTVGGVVLGWVPSFWNSQHSLSLLAVGVVLVLCGVLAKFIKS